MIVRLGDYTEGDIEGWLAACRAMRARLDALEGPVLIAHHGDCDGIVGGGLLARYLGDRGFEVRYASAAEFRSGDFAYFRAAAADCASAVFVEAQGMPPEYRALDPLFLNIDHHPHPSDTPIARMLNPRAHGIAPNPAIGFVMYELLSDDLPSNAAWFAALASIVDYCPASARTLIARCATELEKLDELRDAFLASQYVRPHTMKLAGLIATLPSPEELLAAEPFRARRVEFARLIADAETASRVDDRFVIARTSAGEFRVASPLANRLSDRHPSKCVVVIEQSGDTSRLSVRQRSMGINVGRILGEIVARLGAGDGTGHEKAGSARIPSTRVDAFLRILEEKIEQHDA